MADRNFKRDLRALRHDLKELQERLEDLGESGSAAAKSAFYELRGRLEGRLAHVFGGVREGAEVGGGLTKASEYMGTHLLKRTEGPPTGAFYEVEAEGRTLSVTSVAVFGFGFAVGWLVARR